MMKKSLFIEIVNKWFGAIAKKITETFNGEKEAPRYLHDELLTTEYSADMTWDSSSIDSSIVAADVVALESELPLKKRDSVKRASGDIPKIGMKLYKGEKLITDMRILAARGTSQAQIVAKLFADAPRCAKGIKERLEMIFLQGLSTGVALVDDENNVGTGIRLTYGFLKKNSFGVVKKWGEAGYTPISDIARVISNAKAKPAVIYLSQKAYNLIRQSEEGKMLSANYRGLVITNSSLLPTPTPSQFSDAFSDEYGIRFRIINRTVTIERDGEREEIRPFADETLVFLSSEQLGRLVYSTLAEEDYPVEGVKYEKVGSYILLSKYSLNDPLREFTSSQAIAIPVFDNVEQIYHLNINEAQELAEREVDGDTTITIWEQELLKDSVIDALKELGLKTPKNISDGKLIEKVNELSDEDETKLKQLLGVA